MTVTLSRCSQRAETPIATPSLTPEFCAGGASGPQERIMTLAFSSSGRTSSPIAAAGTRPKSRQRRIAAADRCVAEEDAREAQFFGALLQRGALVGHGDKMLAGLLASAQGRDALEEIVQQNVGLERAAGFRRHDHQCLTKVERRLGRGNLRRIGAVEHVQLRPARLGPECLGKDFGREARTAHAEEQRVGIALSLHMRGEIFELGRAGELAIDDPEPAEPSGFVGAGPERRVARPEAAHGAVLAPSFQLFLIAFLRVAGMHAEGEARMRAVEQPQPPLRHGAEQLVEGVGKEADAVLRELCRDVVEVYAVFGERGEIGARLRQVALDRIRRDDAMVAEGVDALRAAWC